jgi:hypothetical protein
MVARAAGQFVASSGLTALIGAATASVSTVAAGWGWWAAKRQRDVRIASGGPAAPIDPIAVPTPNNPQPNPGPIPIPQPGPDQPVPPAPQPGPQDPTTAPIADTPTPCMLYQIKKGDTFFAIVEKAYGVKQNFQTYAIAQQVNAYPYNQRFWVDAPANEKKLWAKRISFNPHFGDVAQQRQGATKGNRLAAIYFPCVVIKPGDPADPGVANDDQVLDYCPQWSVSETQIQAVEQRVFPLIEDLRGDADFDNARRQNGGKTAEESGFSRQYYEDLALWLAAHMDNFGGITNDPKLVRPLPLGRCTIIGTDQKAMLMRVKTFYVNLFGNT